MFPEIFIYTSRKYLFKNLFVQMDWSDPSDEEQAEMMSKLIERNLRGEVFWKQGYFFVNMILYLDLYLILRQPFNP